MDGSPPDLPPLVGQSPAFLELEEHVARVAPLDRPVLVVGERGTGKELIAARLHFLSRRWSGPFVGLNCAALAESVLESELFGHEAGAFTGAVRRRSGRFELADGGSLFLDEIGEATLTVQEKLLRAVEYGTFERLGGDATLSVDVRLIAATNADLPALADTGRFRPDLLDRLAFDVVTVPPLRARRGDIALLADHFGRAMAAELGWPSFPGFSRAAVKALEEWPWPGNVRELKNVAERAVYRATDPALPVETLTFDPFASPWRPSPRPLDAASAASGPESPPPAHPGLPDAAAPFDFRAVVSGIERRLLAEALASNRHSQRATADHLGLTYSQLRHELRKHGLLPGQG
ncbi:MAG: phage shock protein operon transcriptional activator [Alphaproteobacteria bacterium]